MMAATNSIAISIAIVIALAMSDTNHGLVVSDGGDHGKLVAEDPVVAPWPVAEPDGDGNDDYDD